MKFILALLVVGIAVYLITDRAPAPLQRGTAESDARPVTVREADEDRSLGDGLNSDEMKRRARAAADRLDDARVIAAIKTKFALDKDLAAGDITVRCQNGLVTLFGRVPSRDLAERAMRLAQDTEGVENVRSDLQVTSSEPL